MGTNLDCSEEAVAAFARLGGRKIRWRRAKAAADHIAGAKSPDSSERRTTGAAVDANPLTHAPAAPAACEPVFADFAIKKRCRRRADVGHFERRSEKCDAVSQDPIDVAQCRDRGPERPWPPPVRGYS